MKAEQILMPIAPELFRQGMRCLAAGVTIITTAERSRPSGLTATAVCSLSLDPPQLLVCISRRAGAHDAMARSARFCVNVLSRGQWRLAARFSGQNGGFGAERFKAGKWTTLKTGAPALVDALAAFDCLVTERVDASTHTIFIGRVVDLELRPKGKPLLYASGGYAGLQALAAAARRRRAPAPRVKPGR